MKIAFDAKRALNNNTGLGNYSRILLNALIRDYPDNDYLLFTPKIKDELFNLLTGDFKIFLPVMAGIGAVKGVYALAPGTTMAATMVKAKAFWRSWGVTHDLVRERVNIYHGLSNELPFNIYRKGIATVVTIHDVIFLKHTEQYPWADRQIYKAKTKYAVKHADRIITVSHETKYDLINYYRIPERKIEVIYQSVDPAFYTGVSDKLPVSQAKYILNVGSFYPRKNQQKLVEAYALIANKVQEELWLVGGEGSTQNKLQRLIREKGLEGRVKILTGIENHELRVLYQQASAFVFPSLFEGFGIPVLEAQFSGTPVIATKGGAIEEAAGPHSLFINPYSAEDIAEKILKILNHSELRKTMIEAGYRYAKTMTDDISAAKTMGVYQSLA